MSRFIDRSHRDAVKAMHSLEADGFQAMMAGGCVRDRLLGVMPKDYDIATDALPAQVTEHFKKQGFKVVPTGIEHGTVTVVMPGGPIEVTTLRRDVATDGRHAVVSFGTSFEEDAARRDFTINAMYEDKGGKLFDFHAGQRHIKDKLLVFVGDPKQRIQEDYLRIMRFFRFRAVLGFTTPPETLNAIAAHKDGLKQISQERITSELWLLFASESPLAALDEMNATGVLSLILPERDTYAQKLPHPSVLQTIAVINEQWRAVALFAAVLQLHTTANRQRGAQLLSLAQRLKLPGHEGKRLVYVAELATRLAAVDVNASSGGFATADAFDIIDSAEEMGGKGSFLGLYQPLLAALLRAEADPEEKIAGKALRDKLEQVQRLEERQGHLRTAELPLKGHDVMLMTGLGPGPQLGNLLRDMRRAFRNGEWGTKQEGEDWLRRR